MKARTPRARSAPTTETANPPTKPLTLSDFVFGTYPSERSYDLLPRLVVVLTGIASTEVGPPSERSDCAVRTGVAFTGSVPARACASLRYGSVPPASEAKGVTWAVLAGVAFTGSVPPASEASVRGEGTHRRKAMGRGARSPLRACSSNSVLLSEHVTQRLVLLRACKFKLRSLSPSTQGKARSEQRCERAVCVAYPAPLPPTSAALRPHGQVNLSPT